MTLSDAVRRTLSRLSPKSVKRWGIVLAIPLLATLIVARQHILHRTQGLSIWKGGGMGMFAASEEVNRYLKIYILTPEGNRHPIVQLTPRQRRLRWTLERNPSERNFLRLAESIKRTWWVASEGWFAYRVIDKSGKPVSVLRKQRYLRAGSRRNEDYVMDWKLLVEFWRGRYDPATRLVRVKIAKTFTYPRE